MLPYCISRMSVRHIDGFHSYSVESRVSALRDKSGGEEMMLEGFATCFTSCGRVLYFTVQHWVK